MTAAVDATRGHVEKWFSHKIRVLHFDQVGKWEQPVRVAARFDLAAWDTKCLYFYYYDKQANAYTRIVDPAYWIDSNGYLHFKTEYARDIIMSEGPLERH
jgi:hypothetical protein